MDQLPIQDTITRRNRVSEENPREPYPEETSLSQFMNAIR